LIGIVVPANPTLHHNFAIQLGSSSITQGQPGTMEL